MSRGTYKEHLEELAIIMERLAKAGLKCKIDKCLFCEPEIEYLGYIITKEGVKPQPKKVQAITDMQRPTTKTEVRHFLGMINYYRDLWPRRSELSAPLVNLTRGTKKGSNPNQRRYKLSLICNALLPKRKYVTS